MIYAFSYKSKQAGDQLLTILNTTNTYTMAGGKGGRGKGKTAARPVSRASKAGLQFPVGRIARFMK
jgi:hypothetical protein